MVIEFIDGKTLEEFIKSN